MANECRGRWRTTLHYLFKNGTSIPPPGKTEPDGVNEFGDEDGNGKFHGKHHQTADDLSGRCEHPGGGGHKVSFERPEGSSTFKYMNGKVEGDHIKGGTFEVVGPPGVMPGDGDSGTWESVREGPPGPPLDEHEPDEHADEHAQEHGQGKYGDKKRGE